MTRAMSRFDLLGLIFIGTLTLVLALAPGRIQMGHFHWRKGDPLWTLSPLEDLIIRVVMLAIAVVAWWEVWSAYRPQ